MLSARSWVCGGGQEGLWSAQRTQITPLEHRLGPGNTNQRLGWVLGGWYTGYYPTHPPRPAPPPGTPPPHRTLHQGVLMVGTALLDRSKEILGVDNAHVWGRSQYPRHRHCRRLLIAPLQQGPVGGLPQYISVYLSKSQYILNLRYS